jgi:biopolymer transport protein ExbD
MESKMTVATTRNQNGMYADINMTPLIDVMLVLLIIFIITIPAQTHAIKIDNPAPGHLQSIRPGVIDLSIDFDGGLFWNKIPVDRPTLQAYSTQEGSKTPQPEVHLTVDRFAKYEIVAQTLADLQRHGLQKIAFVNEGYL